MPFNFDPTNTTITGMCQDERGFIWLAKMNADLIRFDGTDRRYFRPNFNDSTALQLGQIECVAAGKGGEVWIGSIYDGLDRYNPATETFTHFRHDPDNPNSLRTNYVSTLFVDRLGTLWIGTDAGVDTLDRETGNFVQIQVDSPAGGMLQKAFIRSIYEDRSGVIWIGAGNAFDYTNSPSSGLYRFQKKTSSITHFRHDPADPSSLIGNRVKAIFEDSKGNFYIGSDGDGLHLMDRETGKFQRLPNIPGNPNALSRPPINEKATFAVDHISFISEDAEGGIWIGTYAGGINRYDPKSKEIEFFGTTGKGSRYMENNGFWTLLKTKDNLIWISSWLPGNENQMLYQVSTLQSNFEFFETGPRAVAFGEDQEKGVWVATAQGVFGHKVDTSEDSFFSLARRTIGPAPLVVLKFDQEGNVWISTGSRGLFFFDRATKTYQNYVQKGSGKEGLASRNVRDVLPISEGNAWIGTNEGLNFFDSKSGKFKLYTHDPADSTSLSSSAVFSLSQDSKGQIWIGTANGIDLLKDESGRFKRYLDGSEISILGIYEDEKGRIWAGSYRSGFFLYDPEEDRFNPYYDHTGLITDLIRINGLVEDESSFLWLFTDNGLIRLNPETNNATMFGNSWKKPSQSGFYSFEPFISKEKEIFIGNDEGYFSFCPDDLGSQYSEAPIPYVTAFLLGGRNISPQMDQKILPKSFLETSEIHLAHNQNTFSFQFASIDFVTLESDKNIRYRLENFDQNWKNGNTYQADYYSLPPGEYTFHIQATNRFGIAGLRSISVSILPPWFTQWWAWLSYALLLFLMLYWIYGFLLRRKLAQAEVVRLQELDQIKTRIYSNLTHEFRTPLTVISGIADHILSHPSVENLKEGVPMIKRNGIQLLRLVNQMLDLSKLQSGILSAKMIHDDILEYLSYLTESFHSYADSKDIRLHFFSDLKTLPMDFDPEKIQTIFSNLLGNAIKFTPSGGNIYLKVEKVKVKQGEGLLELKIIDTGKGIPTEQLSRIFDRFFQVDDSTTRTEEGSGIGLALTKELVQLMSGTIEATSQIGKGSEFTLRLPIRNKAPKGHAVELTQDDIPLVKDTPKVSAIGVEESYDESLPLALLIEDHEDILSYLELCFKGNYRIQKARNGLQGIHQAIEIIPDIIVCDVMMPEKDGFEVVERLKEDERTSHIPIILLTAKADMESRLAGLERGADAYLTKPFNKSELEIRLRKLIEVRQRLITRYEGLKTLPEPKTSAELKEDAFLKKVRGLIESEMGNEEFGISEICKVLGVSRTQLHRKLKALTNKSTSQVIRTIRMQEAMRLLENFSLNISEIGYEVGYSNPSHFTQEFIKEFGEAPSFYRKG
ncbi:hybrid sensor histidine kinase/response regulator transcription factor [Algoriphagus sediminis]|uniref:histidine kinase n=1 Tax=Algoriphagus sediminis TaxID=3057113 RepID=A0ABT7YC73_9BACT|nr:two-component regulator propeller domain-containing protein [Algoriphagus sediminis]MDN3204114.1 two-component regulator propeller domain-containing protein [Algoriphagus sediminis]